MNRVLTYPKRLGNADAQFASRIDHPKTLDRLAVDLELDPLSRAVVEHPVPTLPPAPEYGIDVIGLLAVAKVTREAKWDEFDMGSWCGTKCCAIGHFKRRYPNDPIGNVETAGLCRAFTAIAERFCISARDALYLFDYTEYDARDPDDGSYIGVDREQVAERIEQFVKDHQD